jgi:hypothetical protein
VQQLNDALKSGDLKAAQKAYNDLVTLGNQGLHRDNPYLRSDRGLDFNAIGGALQRGDLDGAKQAFAALQSTYLHHPAESPSASFPAAGAEIGLSLSSANSASTASASGLNVIA